MMDSSAHVTEKNQFSYLPNLHRRIHIQGSNSLLLRYWLERYFSASSLFWCSSLKAQEEDLYRQIHGNISSNKCNLISLSCISLHLHTQAHVYVWKKNSPGEVLSPRVTSSVGCCHGDEWHARAWGQHPVFHMLLLLLSHCCCPDHSWGRGLLHHFLCEQKLLCGFSSADGLQGL